MTQDEIRKLVNEEIERATMEEKLFQGIHVHIEVRDFSQQHNPLREVIDSLYDLLETRILDRLVRATAPPSEYDDLLPPDEEGQVILVSSSNLKGSIMQETDEEKRLMAEIEEIKAELVNIKLHLVAISQALKAVPWQHQYVFRTDEETFPPAVLIDYWKKPED